MKGYTCVDAFCGAGGLGLGLQRAGMQIIFSFDIEKKCIETIKSNKITKKRRLNYGKHSKDKTFRGGAR